MGICSGKDRKDPEAAKASPKAPLVTGGGVRNAALVFIKPHAVTAKMKEFVRAELAAGGLKLLSEGDLSAKQIDEGKLIDIHYGAIAAKATIKKPHELNVPADKFEGKYGITWQEAQDKGLVFNAIDACKELGVDDVELTKLWRASEKEHQIKFGGGFYCSKVPAPGKEGDMIYVFNGFYMDMRGKYVRGNGVHYYVVEWDPATRAWSDFRGKIIGATKPEEADEGSLRGKVYRQWEELGLPGKPDTGNNGIHASASPFEGLAEFVNWLGQGVSDSSFGKALLDAGVSSATVKEWQSDPQVKIDAEGKKGSLFDALEDLDAADCIAKAKQLNQLNHPRS